MKFLCDRCKTRYSIGDDRVRGKILRIRCKNCANVITVREGMPNPDLVDPPPAGATGRPRRQHKTTTAAPAIQSESPAPMAASAPAPARALAPVPAAAAASGAPGAASAPAMAKPPPALEEEWYVSIDGEQAGPFSLADAQRWVAGQLFDAELHCWSEGFDDWLLVDKVSHFRGLRKKLAPAPAAPTPAPELRSATAAFRGALQRDAAPEDTPRPLFAATMAQPEQDPVASELRNLGLAGSAAAAPVAVAPPRPLDVRGLTAGARPLAAPPLATPPNGQSSHRNGAAALQAKAELSAFPAQVATQPGVGAKGRRPFQAGTPDESATQLEPLRLDARGDTPGSGPAPADPGAGDDDLDIGEVSRVVKLADLARDGARRRIGGTPPAGIAAVRAAAAARLEAARPGELASGAGDAGALLAAPDASPVAVAHRRALFALIAGATVLVGVAIAVVFFVVTDEEDASSRLAKVEEIDTTRPEEVRPGASDSSGSGSDSGDGSALASEPPAEPSAPRAAKRPAIAPAVTPPVAPEAGAGATGKLEAREVEEMASKNSEITKRCYMRAQRGVSGIEVGDVKKIEVTLTIGGDGAVTDAQLSDNHAQDALGKCLIGVIRAWRFRPSPGGTFRFVLHFG